MLEFIENDTIISAEKYYESSLIKQKERVSLFIQEAFNSTTPVVCLPFETYPELDDELAESGWVYDEDTSDGDVSVFYPIWYTKSDESVEKYKNNGMPSARMFYESVLKNQWNYLKAKVMSALENGDSEVQLPFDTYPVINAKMKAKGWTCERWGNANDANSKWVSFYPD